MRIDDVTTRDVEVYIAWRSENLWGTKRRKGAKATEAPVVERRVGRLASAATVNRDLSLLSGAFSRLIRHGWPGENPVARAKKPSEKSENEREGLEWDQASALLASCDDRLRPFVATALYTGARKGEIAALRWSDIDFADHSIKVRRTKTKNAIRLPLNSRLEEELLAHRKRQKSAGPAELVFRTKYGNRYENIRAPWAKAVQSAGLDHLPWLCFHSMRHTFAYLYLRQGGGVRELQKILGHSSITTTEKYLRKVADDRLAASMLSLDLGHEKRSASAPCPKIGPTEAVAEKAG
jgi:integrase